MQPEPKGKFSEHPRLIAHRGAMARAPENTIHAFDSALKSGVDGLEFDVQMTKDMIPVVFHDDTLKRIAGERGGIHDHTFADLRALDFGGWFSGKFEGTAIPSLEEVLSRYGNTTILMIEIKTGPHVAHSRHIRKLVEISASLIDRFCESWKENIFILCFDREVLSRFREAAPRIKCILNLKKPGLFDIEIGGPDGMLFGYGLPFRRLTRSFAATAHSRGKKVMTYSCNRKSEIDEALKSGADYLLTDDPENVAGYFRRSLNPDQLKSTHDTNL